MKWSEEETALLLVFAMWGFEHQAISEMLSNRIPEARAILSSTVPLYKRSVPAIRHKLTEIRDKNPGLWSDTTGWDRSAVAAYLYGLPADHALITRLLNLTEIDLEIITRVCAFGSYRHLKPANYIPK